MLDSLPMPPQEWGALSTILPLSLSWILKPPHVWGDSWLRSGPEPGNRLYRCHSDSVFSVCHLHPSTLSAISHLQWGNLWEWLWQMSNSRCTSLDKSFYFSGFLRLLPNTVKELDTHTKRPYMSIKSLLFTLFITLVTSNTRVVAGERNHEEESKLNSETCFYKHVFFLITLCSHENVNNKCSIKCLNGPWLVWPSGLSTGLWTKGLPVRFPVRAHAWIVGQVPSRGRTRGNHTLMFLSLSYSLPSPLSKNK